MHAQAPKLALAVSDDQVLHVARLLGQLVNVVHFGADQDLVLKKAVSFLNLATDFRTACSYFDAAHGPHDLVVVGRVHSEALQNRFHVLVPELDRASFFAAIT